MSEEDRRREEIHKILKEWGLTEEHLKNLPTGTPDAAELRARVDGAVGKTALPAEAKKSVAQKVYAAMSVIGTVHGAWEAIEALFKVLSSFVMSTQPQESSDPEKEGLQRAMRTLESIVKHPQPLDALRQITSYIEDAVVRGLVDAGFDDSGARVHATSIAVLVRHEALGKYDPPSRPRKQALPE